MINILINLGILMRLAAIFILIVSVLPKMKKEQKTVDSLTRLRKLILAGGIATGFIIGLPLVINLLMQMGLIQLSVAAPLNSVINSLGVLVISIILHLIYSLNYSKQK